jgi:hypothetical protein
MVVPSYGTEPYTAVAVGAPTALVPPRYYNAIIDMDTYGRGSAGGVNAGASLAGGNGGIAYAFV